jgi:cytochrome c peroxidase
MTRTYKTYLFTAILAFGTTGLDDVLGQASDQNLSLDTGLREIIDSRLLLGDPSRGRQLPSINEFKAQLGMKLFYSKALSGNRDTACVTCHHPVLGGGDNLSLSVGVDAEFPQLLGQGRLHQQGSHGWDGGPPVPRNAPTTFNIGLWDQFMFHDGRVESLGKTPNTNGGDGAGIRTPDVSFGMADPLAGKNLVHAQARFPVTSKEEMLGFKLNIPGGNQGIRQYLAGRLGGYGSAAQDLSYPDYWLEEFRLAFAEPLASAQQLITEQNISEAIGVYESSQVFVNTPWKAYVEGDLLAISADAKQGALLFYRDVAQGGANCASCHSGDFFTDEGFYNIAMPQIGRGKGNGPDGSDDFGRYRETGDSADLYGFRTPTLLNVEVTGPWGHSGAYTSLEGVVRHHLDPATAVENYDFTQLSQPGIQVNNMLTNTRKALAKLQQDAADGKPVIHTVALDDMQVNQLVEFLKTLTDPCVKSRECLSAWIPDEQLDADPNGDLLIAEQPMDVKL